MFEGLYWLVVSTLIGVPLIGGLYVVATPTHKLMETWQNWKISRAHRPLKDEHFKGLPRTIILCKILGVVVVVASALTLTMIILSMAGITSGHHP